VISTPRQLRKIDANPPPLDIGEAGSPTQHFDTSGDELALPIGPSSAGAGQSKPVRGVAVRSSTDSGSSEIAIPSTTIRPAASPELRSSEEGHATDASGEPLNEAGPSKPRFTDKLKPSPRINPSPRIKENSLKAGSRSLRESCCLSTTDVQAP